MGRERPGRALLSRAFQHSLCLEDAVTLSAFAQCPPLKADPVVDSLAGDKTFFFNCARESSNLFCLLASYI